MNKIFLTALAVLITTPALARDHTDFGNMHLDNMLTMYLEFGDKAAGELEIDRWIDGWMDGLVSIYAYEDILPEDQIAGLTACSRKFTPSELRMQMLSHSTHETMKDWSTSLFLYWRVRIDCESVLGKIEKDKGVSS
jgi:hypothetical protein